jgi:plasmid maintenance system antidote protein VapI
MQPAKERSLIVYPNLKLQIWRIGIRQNRLAQMLGIDETILSKIINGYRTVNPELRSRIAALLQSDENWLFERAAAKADVDSRSMGAGD